MSYLVSGLPMAQFHPLLGLSDEALAARNIRRIVADEDGAYPCRVTLADAKAGETLLLLNYEHLAEESPYRSRHAIFVNEGARETARLEGRMPGVLTTRRLIALRSYDKTGMMIDAEIVPGAEVEGTAQRLLANSAASYLHAHNPARGCYAARIDRLPG